jgi:hypothetical protein
MTFKRLAIFLLVSGCFAGVFAQDDVAPVQNAVLEGVQLSADSAATGKAGEMLVSCYFIFMDKPTSYFYEVRKKTKQLVFEFNDTRLGNSPINSIEQAPIDGFKVEQKQVDINKTVRGLKPEWHTQVSIVFNLSAIPFLNITEQYSVVSFNYKWTTDQSKIANYIEKDNTKAVILWSSAGILAGAGGVATWILLNPPPPPPQKTDLIITDLPSHTPY